MPACFTKGIPSCLSAVDWGPAMSVSGFWSLQKLYYFISWNEVNELSCSVWVRQLKYGNEREIQPMVGRQK